MQLRKANTLAVVAVLLAGRVSAQSLPAGTGASEVNLYARLLAMTDTRRLDMRLVERALASRWRPLREAATLAIGQVGEARGMAGARRLRALLRDRESGVAANAAYALGLLRDTAAVSDLSGALASDPRVAREAAWALGEIGAPSRAAISAGLKRANGDATAIQLLLAAAKVRPVPLTDIVPHLKNTHPSVVWAAAYAIARTRIPAGVRSLLELETSPALRARPRHLSRSANMSAPYVDTLTGNQRSRAEIARGLAKSAAGDSLGSRALDVLSRLADDVDPHVRINAVRSIGTYGPIANAALTRATRDFDPNVRIAAAQSFGAVLSPAGDGLADLWSADTSLTYRTGLLWSATRAGVRPAELREWAASSNWRHRAAAASASGDTLDRGFAIARAVPLTRDPDPRVRQAAYAALVPVASMRMEDSVHTMLVNGLRDPDFYVRATVIGALSDRPSAADLTAIIASYRQAARDSANDARLAAIQYVSALWKKDSTALTSAWRERLRRLPVPGDPLERDAGKSIPVWTSWGNVAATARPLSWYETVVRTIVMPAHAGKTLNATIHTVRGPLHLELYATDAPVTVWNFLSLARSGYYRNTRFHRVVPNFVAQDGDPRDDGNGGPGYSIRDEMNRRRYERGAVGMALSGPDTGGSQYFLTHSPQPHLDGHYTVFARLIRGYDVLDRIVQGDLITNVDSR